MGNHWVFASAGGAGNHPSGKFPTSSTAQRGPWVGNTSGCYTCYTQPRGALRRDAPSCRSHRAEPLSPCIASCSRGGRVGQAAQGVMPAGPGSRCCCLCSFIHVRGEMHLPRCTAAVLRVRAAPGLGSHRAVSVPGKASCPERLQQPSWSFPIVPGLKAPLHGPCTLPAPPGPAAPLQALLSLLRTPRSPEKLRNLWKIRSRTQPCPAPRGVHIPLPAALAGAACTVQNCSPAAAPHQPPEHRGMCVHTSASQDQGSGRLRGAALVCSSNLPPHPSFWQGTSAAFSLARSRPPPPVSASCFLHLCPLLSLSPPFCTPTRARVHISAQAALRCGAAGLEQVSMPTDGHSCTSDTRRPASRIGHPAPETTPQCTGLPPSCSKGSAATHPTFTRQLRKAAPKPNARHTPACLCSRFVSTLSAVH